MNIFKLEEYLSKHEFSAKYLLCCSDAESFTMSEILEMADNEVIKIWNGLRLGYTEPSGLALLRRTVAETLYPAMEEENILALLQFEWIA